MSRAGSIKKDRSGRWYFIVDVRPPGGDRKQVRRRGFRTKDEAQRELNKVNSAVDEGRFTAPTRATVEDYLTEWLATIEPTVRVSTHHSYSRNVRLHVLPHLGDLRLEVVDAGTLNRLYAELLARGNRGHRSGGGLSPRTVRYVHTIIHRALKDAVRWGRLAVNPADVADPPKMAATRRPEVTTWPAATVTDFLARSAEEGDRYVALWVLLATTGMRRGEALGLRWADLELDAGQASIRQTVIAVDHKVLFGSPKTAKGQRSVALDAGTVAKLRAHRARQLSERLMMGSGWTDHDLVFCKIDGHPFQPERVSREFDRRVLRWDLPKITLHGLRHTWATLALQAGVHPRVVQERLGHSTIGITLDTYSHVTAGMQEDAAATVAAMLL